MLVVKHCIAAAYYIGAMFIDAASQRKQPSGLDLGCEKSLSFYAAVHAQGDLCFWELLDIHLRIPAFNSKIAEQVRALRAAGLARLSMNALDASPAAPQLIACMTIHTLWRHGDLSLNGCTYPSCLAAAVPSPDRLSQKGLRVAQHQGVSAQAPRKGQRQQPGLSGDSCRPAAAIVCCLMLNSACSHAQELSSFALTLHDSTCAATAALLPPPEGQGTMWLCSGVLVHLSI